MKQEIANTQESFAPYSTVGKDLRSAVLVVSLVANLFIFTAWLALELAK